MNTSIAGRAVVVGDAPDVVTPVDRNGFAPFESEIAPAFGGRGDVAGPPVHRRERRYVAVDVDGTGFVWRDDGLHRVDDHGDVDLASVDSDELSDDESAELARSEPYT